ncbi:hypothetical protein ABT214_07890, partial [Micromonospora purpureochromogenes]|uniref:hypothetical protein n=1 Tax=Micromonospora purpureochromogenes TaxID=47872 RepID=UPI00332C040C
MKRRRWLLTVLSGATLVLFPGAAHQTAAPTAVAQAGARVEDGPRDGDQRSPGDGGGRPDGQP